MSEFTAAIDIILQHEGHFVDDKADPGGVTNYGISLRYLSSLIGQHPALLTEFDIDNSGAVDGKDIRQMPVALAKEIYKSYWWDKYQYGTIKEQLLANKIFDLSVNMGEHAAHKLLQRACCTLAHTQIMTIDGILGTQTLSYINQLTAEQAMQLLQLLRQEAVNFYQQLVVSQPNLQKFLHGWLNRAVS